MGNEGEESTLFDVYPNPSRGSFYISGNPDRIEVLSLSGASVPFREEREDDRIHVSLSPSPGIFVLMLKKGSAIETRKIVFY